MTFRNWRVSVSAVVLLAVSLTLSARECLLPNGQRFSTDTALCESIAPTAKQIDQGASPRSPYGSPSPGSHNAPRGLMRREGPSADAPDTGGRTLIRGPRGGCYYINRNGNKTYVDRSFCK